MTAAHALRDTKLRVKSVEAITLATSTACADAGEFCALDSHPEESKDTSAKALTSLDVTTMSSFDAAPITGVSVAVGEGVCDGVGLADAPSSKLKLTAPLRVAVGTNDGVVEPVRVALSDSPLDGEAKGEAVEELEELLDFVPGDDAVPVIAAVEVIVDVDFVECVAIDVSNADADDETVLDVEPGDDAVPVIVDVEVIADVDVTE